MRIRWMVFALGSLVLLTMAVGCSPGGDSGKAPTMSASDSDSGISFDGEKITDTNTYLVTGVVASTESMRTGQISQSNSEIDLISPSEAILWPYLGVDSSIQTSSTTAESGKGFVRLIVTESDAVQEAPVGSQVILKTTDTKVLMLIAGDIVTFKCRRDFEPIAAVNIDEKVSEAKHGTWELDYCRLLTPIVKRADE